MKSYNDYKDDFINKYSDLILKYPELEITFIDIFNEGFSSGSYWAIEKTK